MIAYLVLAVALVLLVATFLLVPGLFLDHYLLLVATFLLILGLCPAKLRLLLIILPEMGFDQFANLRSRYILPYAKSLPKPLAADPKPLLIALPALLAPLLIAPPVLAAAPIIPRCADIGALGFHPISEPPPGAL